MKLFIISLGFWILIVPSVVASFLIVAAVAPLVPVFFLVSASFGAALTTAAFLCGPLWTPADLHHSLPPSPCSVTKLIRGEKQ
jgi:hypothetical protein